MKKKYLTWPEIVLMVFWDPETDFVGVPFPPLPLHPLLVDKL